MADEQTPAAPTNQPDPGPAEQQPHQQPAELPATADPGLVRVREFRENEQPQRNA